MKRTGGRFRGNISGTISRPFSGRGLRPSNMHHNLEALGSADGLRGIPFPVPFPFLPVRSIPSQGPLRQQTQGVRTALFMGGLVPGIAGYGSCCSYGCDTCCRDWCVARSGGGLPLVQGFPCPFQSLLQQGPYLGIEPSADPPAPVLVRMQAKETVGVTASLGGLRSLGVLQPVNQPPPTDDTLQLGRGGLTGQLQELRLVFGRGHAGESPHLGEGQLPPGHSPGKDVEIPKCPGHPYLLPSRPGRDSGSPREPFGTGAESPGPALLLIEGTNQNQEMVGGGVDVGGQAGNLLTQCLWAIQIDGALIR